MSPAFFFWGLLKGGACGGLFPQPPAPRRGIPAR
jgi:hypothetical protein